MTVFERERIVLLLTFATALSEQAAMIRDYGTGTSFGREKKAAFDAVAQDLGKAIAALDALAVAS